MSYYYKLENIVNEMETREIIDQLEDIALWNSKYILLLTEELRKRGFSDASLRTFDIISDEIRFI